MDDSELRQKLSSEVDRVSWRPLASHCERGTLWLLGEGLDLIEVGLGWKWRPRRILRHIMNKETLAVVACVN